MRTLTRSILIVALLITCTTAWADGFMVPVHQMDSFAASGGSRLGNSRAYFASEGKIVAVNKIQNIGTQTFYQRGSQWVDSQSDGQKDLKVVQVKQFSNAHFKLLAAYPELNQYQRLGNMRIVVNNQALEIGDKGKEDLTDAEIKAIIGN